MTEQSDYTVGVLIYVSKSMREQIKKRAHQHEKNMSEYVRHLVQNDMEGATE